MPQIGMIVDDHFDEPSNHNMDNFYYDKTFDPLSIFERETYIHHICDNSRRE
jgi:hypothetical protein